METSQEPKHDPSDTIAAMRRTTKTLVDGYNQWDISGVMDWRSDNCIHVTLPVSLAQPDRNNAEYVEYWSKTVRPLFRNFTVVIDVEVHDAAQRISSVRAHSTAETPVGPYKNEYTLFIYHNQACDRVERFEEFVDSNVAAHFFPRLRTFLAEKAGGSFEEAWRLHDAN